MAPPAGAGWGSPRSVPADAAPAPLRSHPTGGARPRRPPAGGPLDPTGSTPVSSGNTGQKTASQSGAVTYVPAPDANGWPYDQFLGRARDDGGTTGGGIDPDLTTRTMSITVTPQPD